MTPPSADSVIGTTSSLSSLIVENFLSLNRLTGNENCRIAGICGHLNETNDFIPDMDLNSLFKLAESNDLFLMIQINPVEDSCTIVGWSDNDFNKSATKPLAIFGNEDGSIIPISSINPRMELFIDRIIN
jgi:hypothetical protein